MTFKQKNTQKSCTSERLISSWARIGSKGTKIVYNSLEAGYLKFWWSVLIGSFLWIPLIAFLELSRFPPFFHSKKNWRGIDDLLWFMPHESICLCVISATWYFKGNLPGLLNTSPQWIRDRIWRAKVWKSIGWDKDGLIGKAKQNKEFNPYFPPAGQCSAIPRTAGIHGT